MPSVASLRPRPACAGTGGRHASGLGGRDHRNTHGAWPDAREPLWGY